jgi:hypothetical protein
MSAPARRFSPELSGLLDVFVGAFEERIRCGHGGGRQFLRALDALGRFLHFEFCRLLVNRRHPEPPLPIFSRPLPEIGPT